MKPISYILTACMLVFPQMCHAGVEGKLQIEEAQFDFTSASTNSCTTPPKINVAVQAFLENSSDSEPLSNAKVVIYELDSKDRYKRSSYTETKYTNGLGKCVFCELYTDSGYLVVAEKKGYVTTKYRTEIVESAYGDSTPVTRSTLYLYKKEAVPEDNGKIKGYVYNKDSDEGFDGNVKMKVKGNKKKYIQNIVTESDGYFEFYDLVADTYRLSARKGKKSYNKTIKLESNMTYEFNIFW